MRSAFGQALLDLAHEIDDMVVLDGDNATSTRTEEFGRAHPESFFNVGIAEQNLVGAAAGLALVGCKPVACAFASMLVNRALDQITHAVAHQRAAVTLAGHYAGMSGAREGACHHSITDLAVLRAVPNLDVLVPAADSDVRPLLRHALTCGRPVYLRLSREPAGSPPTPDRGSLAEGWRYWGPDFPAVVLVAVGPVLTATLGAQGRLPAIPGGVGVLNVLTLKPLPTKALSAVTRDAHAVVTVEEHSTTGGLGGAIAEWAAAVRPLPLIRLGIADTFTYSASHEELLAAHGLTEEHITSVVSALPSPARPEET
jgi:transketolase